MSSKATFTALNLLPELFPLVASHLPLYATPSTLLSLALTNHAIYASVHNLLYSRLILRNEKDAISTFQRILSNPGLGKAVRELHIMSELSVATMNGETVFDTVTGLKLVIKAGAFPYLHTFDLRLLRHSFYDTWYERTGFGHLPADFWADLHSKCPRVRTIFLSGIGDKRDDPWLHESGIYELKGFQELTHLGLSFSFNRQVQSDGTDRLLRNIRPLSSSLHTLVLILLHIHDSASPILSLDFPQLRSLTLGMFSDPDTSEAMAFWRRHPLIEKLKFTYSERTARWFSETSEGDLLPNLKYLEANFYHMRSLIPILPRLIGLSIQQSVNAQVPYLLRCLIPAGLPNLASLEIDQTWSRTSSTLRMCEGSMWYETPEGNFHQEKHLKNAGLSFMDDYIHSIVKGAPNLKELCLHGIYLHPLSVERITPQLAEFTKLERFYYRGLNDSNLSLQTPENRDAFYTSARAIAEKCKTLERITDISNSPYLATKIRRNDAGEVKEAIPTEGYGMIIGSEDEAFPSNPAPILDF